jgi:hypothetical protein
MSKRQYKELSSARIKGTRNVVISKDEANGTFTMAQQLLIEEGNKVTSIFMKGAFIIENLTGLYNLRDALNEAITKQENEILSEGNKYS